MITDNLHPDLLAKITRVLAGMSAIGFPMKIVQGLRTVEAQQKLYAQGRTVAGEIVTDADGVKVRSNHQAGPDGLGRAVDCAFLGPDPFNDSLPWSLYGAACEAVGLVWGGGTKAGWHGQDRPHAQLTKV